MRITSRGAPKRRTVLNLLTPPTLLLSHLHLQCAGQVPKARMHSKLQIEIIARRRTSSHVCTQPLDPRLWSDFKHQCWRGLKQSLDGPTQSSPSRIPFRAVWRMPVGTLVGNENSHRFEAERIAVACKGLREPRSDYCIASPHAGIRCGGREIDP